MFVFKPIGAIAIVAFVLWMAGGWEVFEYIIARIAFLVAVLTP